MFNNSVLAKPPANDGAENIDYQKRLIIPLKNLNVEQWPRLI